MLSLKNENIKKNRKIKGKNKKNKKNIYLNL